MTKTILLSLIALTAFLVSGCGTDPQEPEAAKNNAPGKIALLDCGTLPKNNQIPAPEKGANCVPGLANISKKPVIPGSDAPAPKKLITEDVVKGIGSEIKKGDQVSVQYVGSVWGTDEEFDSSWDRGIPFKFTVGSGEVIEGWDRGLIGAKEGSRRILVIPPSLGYGAVGAPPSIPGNATLVFVVDVEKVIGPNVT